MAKQSLAWHQECLINQKQHLDGEIAALERKKQELERLAEEYLFYAKQVKTAEKEGKATFDEKRYLATAKKASDPEVTWSDVFTPKTKA